MPARTPPRTGYFTTTFRSALDGSEQPLALWVPRSYSPHRAYPLLVALHGTDADERMIPEQCFAIHRHGFREDLLFLSPFGRGDLWFRWMGEVDLWEAIGWVNARYRLDPRRRYLTGLSMGGYACWRLACDYPDQWAAIAPVCGGGDPQALVRLKDVPLWCVHGEKDPYVPVEQSRRLIAELQRLHYPHRYDELIGCGHHSWEWLYRPDRHQDTLADWFLQFRRPLPTPLLAQPQNRGGFDDLFHHRLVISYPAQTPIPRETEWLRAEAERVARFSFGDVIMRAPRFPVKADAELTAEELRQANHLMLGRSDNHRWLGKAARKLLARHEHGRLRVGEHTYLRKTLAVATVQPSPFNPKRQLGVITYQQCRQIRGFSEQLFNPEVRLPAVNLYDTQEKRFLPPPAQR